MVYKKKRKFINNKKGKKGCNDPKDTMQTDFSPACLQPESHGDHFLLSVIKSLGSVSYLCLNRRYFEGCKLFKHLRCGNNGFFLFVS